METKILVEALEGAGYSPRSYSGRGMFGRKCVGVVIPEGTSTFQVGVECAIQLEGVVELRDLEVRQDAMGLDTIIYFPQVEWIDEESDEYSGS